MEAVFYSFGKRRNSTMQPTGDGTTMTVNLKAATDLRSPIFSIMYDGIPSFNYMTWNGQYFWIDSIESIRDNVWAIHARIDVLATFKADILATTAYVVYDTTANSEIVDSRLPIKKSAVITRASTELNPQARGMNGSFVITVNGQENGCESYIIGYSYLLTLLKNLQNWIEMVIAADSPDDLSNIWAVIMQIGRLALTGGNVIDQIRSIVYVPFNISGGSLEEIYLGRYPTGIYGNPIGSDFIQSNVVTINIPWQASDWRRKAPYTQVNLTLPYVGKIALQNDQIISRESLRICTSVNKITGAVSYEVYASDTDTNIIGVYGGNAGYILPYGVNTLVSGQIFNNLLQFATGGLASAAGGNLAGVISTATATINSMTPNTTCIGGASGGAGIGINQNAEITVIYHDTAAAPSAYSPIIGTPSMVVKSIANLTGFVQTDHFQLSKDTLSANVDEVNALMDGGVYIE